MYVDSSGTVVGTSDGAAVVATDPSGAYQEADGTWYTPSGSEMASPPADVAAGDGGAAVTDPTTVDTSNIDTTA